VEGGGFFANDSRCAIFNSLRDEAVRVEVGAARGDEESPRPDAPRVVVDGGDVGVALAGAGGEARQGGEELGKSHAENQKPRRVTGA
jgi:hypothetical protein